MKNPDILSQSDISIRPTRVFFLSFILTQLGFLVLFTVTDSPVLILLVMVGLFLLYRIAFSVKGALFFTSFYIVIFPAYGWGRYYPFFKVFVSYPVLVALIVLAVLFWMASIALRIPTRVRMTAQDIAALIFLFLVVIATFIGLVNGHQTKHVAKECFFLGLYGVYFLAARGIPHGRWIKQYWSLLILATLVVSLQYLFLALSEIGPSRWFISRVTTRQPHLAQLAIPYLMSFFLLPSTLRKKIFASLLLVPILTMAFLSQQRSLWLAIPFSIILLWLLTIWRRQRISFQAILKVVAVLLIFVIIIITVLLLLNRFFAGSPVATLAVRVESLTRLAEDESALMRMAEIKRALAQWRRNVLFGTGLGSTIHRVAVNMKYDMVDNSYVFLLWKTGLIGLFSYLVVVVLFFHRGMTILKRTDDLDIHRIVISSLSGFAGLMLIALTNSCLVLYRFIIIWAILIASLEYYYRNITIGDLSDHRETNG